MFDYNVICISEWRSQALKSGGHRGSGGWKPLRGSGAKPPEAICSCQMLFNAGLLSSPSSVSPQKNCSYLRESHDPIRPGQGAYPDVTKHHIGIHRNQILLINGIGIWESDIINVYMQKH